MSWLLSPASSFSSFADALALFGVPSDAGAAAQMAQLHQRCTRRLQAEGLTRCFTGIESRLPWVLAKVYDAGFPIDVQALEAAQRQVESALAAMERELRELTGMPGFNPQSPEDIRCALFDNLRLHERVPPGTIQRTPKLGVLSTGEDTLRALTSHHRLPSLIMQYRKAARLNSTYLQSLPLHAEATRDGVSVVRPHFCQQGTDTGRLSCSAPNLQNQPRGGGGSEDTGVSVRGAFRPFPGEELVSFDYSQIEVRVLAHVSADPLLASLLSSGADLHRNIAAAVFSRSADDVTADERQTGKKIVFGAMYGQGPRGLSQQLCCSLERAQMLLDRFRLQFPTVQRWAERVVAECRSSGRVRTFMNRLRLLPDISSRSPAERSHAERQAVNTVIQGSAADIIKRAMIVADRPASEAGLRLVCQVHDELLYSGAAAAIDSAAPRIRAAMEQAAVLCVPLVVSVSRGSSWGSLAPVRV
eukprot:TRINITY_DN4225_c0_g1_i2.p1 TRINITY_DN4225_c0_g1~~TRINITY_DN4225_c0_g1_i2.p1  ORF type:complete len:473 (+),score=172.11 TRINITY_DN4225_c0_g1_i2:1075-2493(+)